MPRRQDHGGAWQHVMNRCIDRRIAQAYLGLVRTPAWLHTEAIPEMLGPHNARQRYRELLGEEADAAMPAVHGEAVPWGQTRRV